MSSPNRVLIVDDDPVNIELLTHYLTGHVDDIRGLTDSRQVESSPSTSRTSSCSTFTCRIPTVSKFFAGFVAPA